MNIHKFRGQPIFDKETYNYSPSFDDDGSLKTAPVNNDMDWLRRDAGFDGMFVYGSLVWMGDKPFIVGELIEANEEYDALEWWVPVLPETVGRFTGLFDKHNKEIYEGDLIDIHQTVNGCNLFEIVWDKTRWNAVYAMDMVIPRLYEYDFNQLMEVELKYPPYEREIEVVGNNVTELLRQLSQVKEEN